MIVSEIFEIKLDNLIDRVVGLYRVGKWPEGYHLGTMRNGDYIRIEKKRPMSPDERREEGISNQTGKAWISFEVGSIRIIRIDENYSALESHPKLTDSKAVDPDFMSFFRVLLALIQDPTSQSRQSPIKSKRGPRRYSKQRKINAIRTWDAIDRDIYPIKLEEYLEEEFGTEAGVLKVAPSTFHGWRKLLENP